MITHHSSNGTEYTDADTAALFAVALSQGSVSGLEVREEEWEDMCRESGRWEFVDGCISSAPGNTEARNEFGGMCFEGFNLGR